MKTIFTILIIFILAISTSAQKISSSIQKNGVSVSGISDENQTFSISKIYPNPVRDFVTVELYSAESGSVQASLINILGTEIKKWDSFPLQSGDQKLKIDLSFLKTGIYFLKMSNSGKVVTQVLKKN